MKETKFEFTEEQIAQYFEDDIIEGYTEVYKSLSDPTSVDPYDSNEYTVVFKEEATGKFYKAKYDKWENGSDDVPEYFDRYEEVFPVEKTIIVYE
jgi:hypothetical protein